MSFALITISGFVGGDPHFSTTQKGTDVVDFNVGVKTYVPGKDPKTEWYRCTAFGQQKMDTIKRFVRKGTSVTVCGRLSFEEWQDRKTGGMRTTPKVIIEIFNLNDRPADDRSTSYQPQDNGGFGDPTAPTAPQQPPYQQQPRQNATYNPQQQTAGDAPLPF